MKHTLIAQPILSEKTMKLAQQKWYTFKVANVHAVKTDIAHAIQNQFKVHVVSIKTLVVKAKTVRTGRRRLVGRSSNWKKAMVYLKPNEKIDVFSVEEQPVTNK